MSDPVVIIIKLGEPYVPFRRFMITMSFFLEEC